MKTKHRPELCCPGACVTFVIMLLTSTGVELGCIFIAAAHSSYPPVFSPHHLTALKCLQCEPLCIFFQCCLLRPQTKRPEVAIAIIPIADSVSRFPPFYLCLRSRFGPPAPRRHPRARRSQSQWTGLGPVGPVAPSSSRKPPPWTPEAWRSARIRRQFGL